MTSGYMNVYIVYVYNHLENKIYKNYLPCKLFGYDGLAKLVISVHLSRTTSINMYL